MARKDWAKIPVLPDTRDDLRAEKIGGETYDDVVNRLLREYNSDNAASHTSDTGT
jgi:hypothetical protein